MQAPRSLRIKLLGGLAGVVLGLALTLVWSEVRSVSRSPSDTPEESRTLSGDDSAASTPAKVSAKAEALSKIIEIRLRANEFNKALDLLKQANGFNTSERDRIYEDAADVVLKPAAPGGENYLAENGGKDVVLTKLSSLYTIANHAPDSPVKVKLLLRMRNVYDAFGRDGGIPTGGATTLPGPEKLMDDATRIANSLPSEAGTGLPWVIGSVSAFLFGSLGLILSGLTQEFVKTAAQEFAKAYGSARFKDLFEHSRTASDDSARRTGGRSTATVEAALPAPQADMKADHV